MRTPILGLVVAASCAHAPAAKHPDAPRDTDHVRNYAAAKSPLGATWRVGVGVDGCAIGADLDACTKTFGTPIPDEANVQLALFPKAGVEVFADDGIVQRVFVRYRYPGATPYPGGDPGGIGAHSTIADVTYAYGPPASERDVDEAGVPVHHLVYDDRALTFVFAGGTLAGVMLGEVEAKGSVAARPPAITPPTCPLVVLHQPTPQVATYASVAAAQAALFAGATPSPDENLAAALKDGHDVAAFPVLVRAYAGSTRVHRQHAVIAASPKKIVVLAALGDVWMSLPPDRCSAIAPDEILGIRKATSTRYPHLAIVRYRRRGVSDAVTLPDAPPDAACPGSITYRIEDHVIDLDTGTYLVGWSQTFRGARRGELPATAIAFDQITFPGEPSAPHCDGELRWPFAEGE